MKGSGILPGSLLVAALALPCETAAYVADDGIYTPVNYAGFLPPGPGASYIDPAFGTVIKRLSGAVNTPNSADAGYLPFISHEYATMSPFNADNSRVLVLHHSYFALYDGQGNYLEDLPFEINAASEPRWSRREPQRLYYLAGNQLKSFDVDARIFTTLRVFNEYTRVSGFGESDLSVDGDHMVLVGDAADIFVYRLSTGSKGPVLDATGNGGFDQVSITPDNNVLVTWNRAGGARFSGVELYDQDMVFLRQVAPAGGHMDVARDLDGAEVIFWANAADPDPPPDCQNAIVKIRLADGSRTCLISFAWGLALHVSAADESDWLIVSSYAPGDPLPPAAPAGGWTRFTNEIVQLRPDGSGLRRLAHHRSRPFNDYYYTPRAAVSRDGLRLLYSSNYGLQAMLGYAPYYSDAYLVDLSNAGIAAPGSEQPASTRVEEDAPVVRFGGAWHRNGLAAHSGASAMLAMEAGAAAHVEFNGTEARWIAYRDQWSGVARVSVDGILHGEIDTYAAAAKPQAHMYAVSGLPPGPHTLTIEVSGYSNPASAGAWIWVDAFDVTARVEQQAPAAAYSGDWYTLTHPRLSGESVTLAMNAGGRVDFAFSGSAVSWVGYRDRWSGIARVLLDGVPRAEIDTYAPGDQVQACVYTLSNLEPGGHLLSIEVTGTRNPASGGAWVWVDAFDTAPLLN